MSKCFVCGERETPGDYSRVWAYMGKRAYCEKHVPSRKTLRRKVRELRASTPRTSANVTLGNAPRTRRGPALPKVGSSPTLPKVGLELPKKATLRLELVLCGKSGCKKLHGPYWYAYWRVGSRVQKKYIGKSLPPTIAQQRLAPRRRKRGAAADARVLEELELGGDDE